MKKHYCMYCMETILSGVETCEHCHTSSAYEAPIHHIKPGTVLRDKYLVGSALGEGGFGITYIGRDLLLDMRVAIKEYYPSGYTHRNNEYTNDVTHTQNSQGQDFEKDMQRFLNEARMMAKFSNESGIVGVRDFFRENGTAYIVMEYLDGITLKEYLKQRGRIPAEQLFKMIDPVLQSLSKVHAQGMIHRDISPDNIMLLNDGRLKLLDFGAAREVTDEKSLSVVLKHGYAPEEQYRTKGRQGPWTDVYAMCATMYKCLTGITPMESLERVYQDELQPPSQLGIQIPSNQEKVLLRGLSIRVGDRIQNMDALREGLFMREGKEQIHAITISKQEERDDVTRFVKEAATVSNAGSSSVDEDDEMTIYQHSDYSIPKADEDVEKTVYQGKKVHRPLLQIKKNDDTEPQTRKKAKAETAVGEKNDKDKRPASDNSGKHKKNGVTLVAVVGVVAIILIVVLVLPGLFSGSADKDLQSVFPTEREMASDCNQVLKRESIPGKVLDLNVQQEKLNEKYKTLVIFCEVTVLDESEEKTYTIELHYDMAENDWVLSDLSTIN